MKLIEFLFVWDSSIQIKRFCQRRGSSLGLEVWYAPELFCAFSSHFAEITEDKEVTVPLDFSEELTLAENFIKVTTSEGRISL